MKCNNVDTLIAGALVLSIFSNCLGLSATFLRQRCTKKKGSETEKEKELLFSKIENLEQRIVDLENK